MTPPIPQERPRILDLFSGAGGAAMGYYRAGFEVVGVDIEPQPHYPFSFRLADALDFTRALAGDGNFVCGKFQAIHASPPCQAYTSMRHMGNGAGVGAKDLVGAVRRLLAATGLPYVIENVPGSPLRGPVRLCGSSVGLPELWRHRHFETNFPVMVPPCSHGQAPQPIAVYGDHPEDCRGTYRVRRARTLEEGQRAMGIDWMPWKPLTQAIPPAMTEHIGGYLLTHLQAVQKEAA